MNTVNGIMFAILIFIAAAIEVQLHRSKLNGFKKILQGFFGAEMWISICFLLFECSDYGVSARGTTQWAIFFAFIPKVYYKIRFYIYTHKH